MERNIHFDNTPAVAAAANFVVAFVLPEDIANWLVVGSAAVMDRMVDNTDLEEVAYLAVARPMEEEVVEYLVVVDLVPLHHLPQHPSSPTLHSTRPNFSHVLLPSFSPSLLYVSVPNQVLVHLTIHGGPSWMHILQFVFEVPTGCHLVLLLEIQLTFSMLQ